uniref:Uncharacterized protein n=1 Tax=Anguilla anguilla TaxID=7936 RepID=A0A0E9W2K4_ANGAN
MSPAASPPRLSPNVGYRIMITCIKSGLRATYCTCCCAVVKLVKMISATLF